MLNLNALPENHWHCIPIYFYFISLNFIIYFIFELIQSYSNILEYPRNCSNVLAFIGIFRIHSNLLNLFELDEVFQIQANLLEFIRFSRIYVNIQNLLLCFRFFSNLFKFICYNFILFHNLIFYSILSNLI